MDTTMRPIARDSKRDYGSYHSYLEKEDDAFIESGRHRENNRWTRSLSATMLPMINEGESTQSSAVRLMSRVMSKINNTGAHSPSRKPVREQYFCMICRNNNSVEEGFILEHCGHVFCRSCFKEYITLKVNDGKVHPCCFYNPTVLDRKGPTCTAPVSSGDIRRLLDPEDIQKYERFLRRDKNSNMRDCPKCNKDQLGDPERPWMTCKSCGHEYCFEHADAHSRLEACGAYEARMAKDKAYKLSESLIRRTSKKCPGCGTNIEKLSGCNHMTCTVCHTGFCWICLEEIGHSTMPEHFNPKGSNPCAGRQFENEDMPQLPLHLWEVHICLLLPMLLVLLLVPIVFFLVAALSLVFCVSLCFLAVCGRDCWEAMFRFSIVVLCFPVLVISSPVWLPCLLYIQCVVARRNRRPLEDIEDNDPAFNV
ncbi:hypothetical protein AAMO2058_001244100 [Amorphochlora amoebiformis]